MSRERIRCWQDIRRLGKADRQMVLPSGKRMHVMVVLGQYFNGPEATRGLGQRR